MSASDRQSRLIVAEDWKRIYQSFRNADFQSYDFDNLRRTMINYLRQNYPEDFNDYIESSEYLALIDMIAFLGQNLSFRIDLNARENFLETAERRESILRLANMLAYNPKRNQTANGLLRIETVKTTESIKDSSGLNLSGFVVKWNDQSNANYFEQFIKILNAALPVSNSIGNPLKSANINGVQHQKYRFNATNKDSAIFKFTKQIEGVSTRFEVVSSDISETAVNEEPPIAGTSPAFLFRDDGQGSNSNNTGFFMHFKQGVMNSNTFSISNPTPNQVVSIDAENINNTDVWLYGLDSNGIETVPWIKVDSIEGNNVIYNNLFNGIRDVFSVLTRIGDRINLVFSDGVFGSLPSGNFKVFYRTSANARSVITPGAIGTVNLEIPYESRSGTLEKLILGLRLNYTISNGSASETNLEIKQNAPATYYTQNRLITGEDYNIGPLAIDQDIIKTKSTNRISSGVSKYFDLKDVSGKYSNTSLFADDGVLFKEYYETKTQFKFASQSDIEGIIYNTIEPIITSTNVKNFYLDKQPKVIAYDLNVRWDQKLTNTNRCTGTLIDIDNRVNPVGVYTASSLRFIETGTMCKFVAPATSEGVTQYFTKDGKLTTDSTMFGASPYKWTNVLKVIGDGTTVDDNNVGAIELTDTIPSGAILDQLMPKLSRSLTKDAKIQIIDQAFAYKDFGLRYNIESREWTIITEENINTSEDFATGKAGDTSGRNFDSSWFLYFKTDSEKYTITYRNLRYVFESENALRFYFDSADKIYDPTTGTIVRDFINVMSINRKPDSIFPFNQDFKWSILDSYKDKEGYLDSRKIQIQFLDLDDDTASDNIDMFNTLVDELVNPTEKIVFQKRYVTSDGVEDFKYFNNNDATIKIIQNESKIIPSVEIDGQVFYLVDEHVFKTLNKAKNNTVINTNYKAYVGRSDLKFHYVHVADSNYRIDPSASNLIDTYLLTKSYDTEMRKYINGTLLSAPKPPSSDELFRKYHPELSKIKSISDEIVYHPVKYKILFGSKAVPDLQVKFKIVRNKELIINENELKADIIQAIDRFFEIENWDFGETFYFQELSAYIMNTLTPKLLSIIIVPRQGLQAFGSLFEIKSEIDEIFINSAKVSDIEVIDEITASELQASGDVITNVTTSSTGNIISTASTSLVSPNGGGYTY